MVLGMSLSTFTTIHVIISLIGIASGLVVLCAMIGSRRAGGWTALFLATTVLTTVTGFMFPLSGLTPAVITGILSAVILAIALVALYVQHLRGAWRAIYVITALIALYLNSFVGVVQTFQKIPFFAALAPTQSEPPFAIAQGALLLFFAVTGFLAVRKFHPV